MFNVQYSMYNRHKEVVSYALHCRFHMLFAVLLIIIFEPIVYPKPLNSLNSFNIFKVHSFLFKVESYFSNLCKYFLFYLLTHIPKHCRWILSSTSQLFLFCLSWLSVNFYSTVWGKEECKPLAAWDRRMFKSWQKIFAPLHSDWKRMRWQLWPS